MRKLRGQEEKFCIAHAVGGKSLTDSYREAYNTKTENLCTVQSSASRVAKRPPVAARILELRKQVAEEMAKTVGESGFSIPDLVKQWIAIVTTDVNEIVQNRRINCRYCFGVDHQYQWINENEFAIAVAKAIDKRKRSDLKDNGGYGYSNMRDPCRDCPMCFGEGIASLYIADTRKLSPGAKLLYRGVRKSRHGMEVMLHDAEAARQQLAKYFGMFKEKYSDFNYGDEQQLPETTSQNRDPNEASKTYQRIMTDGK